MTPHDPSQPYADAPDDVRALAHRDPAFARALEASLRRGAPQLTAVEQRSALERLDMAVADAVATVPSDLARGRAGSSAMTAGRGDANVREKEGISLRRILPAVAYSGIALTMALIAIPATRAAREFLR